MVGLGEGAGFCRGVGAGEILRWVLGVGEGAMEVVSTEDWGSGVMERVGVGCDFCEVCADEVGRGETGQMEGRGVMVVEMGLS